MDYSTRARDRRALTLDELIEFVAQLRAAGVSGSSPLRALTAIEIDPAGARLLRLTCEPGHHDDDSVVCSYDGCGDRLPLSGIVLHLYSVHGIHPQTVADAAVEDVTGENPHPEAST